MIKEPLGHTILRVLDVLHSLDNRKPITFMETGTCRDLNPDPGDPEDARSTLAVARWVANNPLSGHRCFSIDLHAKHLEIAKQVLGKEKLSELFEFIQSNGSTGLASLAKFKPNVVLLDADSNHGTTYEEYKSIVDHMDIPGFIIIDDINRNGINKGKLILEERLHLSLPWKMIAKHVAIVPIGSVALEATRLL